MRFKIEVTKTDIKKGVKESFEKCAVARAIRRVTRQDVEVDGTNVEFTDLSQTAVLPKKMTRWICEFDKLPKSAMKPISFTLVV